MSRFLPYLTPSHPERDDGGPPTFCISWILWTIRSRVFLNLFRHLPSYEDSLVSVSLHLIREERGPVVGPDVGNGSESNQVSEGSTVVCKRVVSEGLTIVPVRS